MARPDTTSPRVLQALARGDALTITQIRDRTGLPWATVDAALHRLQDRGEVARSREVGITVSQAVGNANVWRLATPPKETAR
jgi:DNA-binding IclR family transcriptional regulator